MLQSIRRKALRTPSLHLLQGICIAALLLLEAFAIALYFTRYSGLLPLVGDAACLLFAFTTALLAREAAHHYPTRYPYWRRACFVAIGAQVFRMLWRPVSILLRMHFATFW